MTVMDDETYVKEDFIQVPGNLYVNAKDKCDVPENLRTQKLSTFAKKFLIWKAICFCGKLYGWGLGQGFTMYTTCVIWLAFIPLYFGTGNNVQLRITSISVTISLSATVTLVCLFSPKLYIILIRPERNVRQSMMPIRYSTINKTTGSAQSSMMAAVMVTAATCNENEKVIKPVSNENITGMY